MATRFDRLESERRRNEAEYLPGLSQMYAQSAPPRPWMRRPGSLGPIGNPPIQAEDPTPTDTFDQRFNPSAYPPVAPPKGESPYPIPSGTRERFLDPTKVVADASGQILPSGKNSGEQPYPVKELPPGLEFDFDPESDDYDMKSALAAGLRPDATGHWPSRDPATGLILKGRKHPTYELTERGEAEAGYEIKKRDGRYYSSPHQKELPAGLKFDDEVGPEIPTDPFERAAIRTRRAASGSRPEGTATRVLEGAIPAIGEAVGREAQRFGEMAQTALQTGDLPPRQAMEMALIANPTSAAYRTGLGIAKAARTPAEAAQIETGVLSIPRAAEGGQTAQTTGRAISGLPIVGSGLRAKAEKATQELQAAGTAAAAKPTGEAVAQEVAGRQVRTALKNVEGLSPKLRSIVKGSDEDAIGNIIRMAGSKQGADAATLVQLRRLVPTESHGAIQSAIIARLGRGPTGEFDPKAWLKGYANLSDRGKNILFGREGGLRTHLDAIESVSRRAPSWQQFQSGRSALGTAVGVVGLVGSAVGAYKDPLSTLGTVVPLGLIARSLSKPALAAPIAQWSRAYERVIRTRGTPQAIATFTIATRNLNNSLGTEVNPLAILRGSENEQPVE